MPRKNHTHKYILRPTGSQPVWACALPDCNHYMPPHLNSLIEGRSSICWECEDKFILDDNAMKELRPRCFNCRSEVSKIIPMESLSEPVIQYANERSENKDKKVIIERFLKGI